jgi:tetratricopeptide (TPR) repeat protein
MAASTGMNTPEKSLEARRHAENGLNGNPHDGHLWGLLANVLVSDYLNNWNGAGKAEVDRAEEAANKAASLDANVALAHYSLGFIRRVRGDHDGALAAFSKAIEIDPNLAKAYAQKANELVFTGKPRDAIPLADQAAKLSPKDPSIGVFYWVKGRAYFAMGEYQNAIEWLAKSTEVRPNLWFSQAWLTAAYALTNRDTDAQAARQKLETNFKRFNLAHITDIYSKDSQYNNPTLKRASAELIKGLQEAGLK